MAANAGYIVGWNRPIPGHEAECLSKFPEYAGFLGKLQASGQIESFEPVFTWPHGGDLNGFFFVKGDKAKLAQLNQNEEWLNWQSWGSYHMMNFGIVPCHVGDAVQGEIGRWGKFIKR